MAYDVRLKDGTIRQCKEWSCFLCDSPMNKSNRTKHHLKPKAETDVICPNIIYVHRNCHQRIHKLFNNRELLLKYSDALALRSEFLRRRRMYSQGKFKNYSNDGLEAK